MVFWAVVGSIHMIASLERLLNRNIRHLSARYVRDRLAVALHERRNPEQPWLTSQAVAIIESWLKPTDSVWEWGSGRSTAWFAERTGHLVSVEHSADWYANVSARLQARSLMSKVTYYLLPDGITEDRNAEYVRVIDGFPDESLDVVLVDGVARAFCAKAAISKLKTGGLLIIDNANWFLRGPFESRSPNSRNALGAKDTNWEDVQRTLTNWRVIWTSNGVTDTALWVKPSR